MKSDYDRIEITYTLETERGDFTLKSDYDRIEMFNQLKLEGTAYILKSDYDRIEIGFHFTVFCIKPA